MINPQSYYNLGFEAGKKLYDQSREYEESTLRNIANREIAKATIPMTMQIHYRDGLLAGYEAAKENPDISMDTDNQ